MKKKARKPVRSAKGRERAAEGELALKFEPRGPDPARISTVSRALADHPAVQEFLAKTRNRLLTFELVEPEPEAKSARPSPPPHLFRATFYDYTNNRTIFVDGDLNQPKRVKVSESSFQPLPSNEEFDAAVKLLLKDPNFGPTIRENQHQPYRAMPPIVEVESPDGRLERTIAVGLLPVKPGIPHEIVGVNLIRQTVVRFDERAPRASAAHNPICGISYIQQSTANRGDAGQVWVTVSQ